MFSLFAAVEINQTQLIPPSQLLSVEYTCTRTSVGSFSFTMVTPPSFAPEAFVRIQATHIDFPRSIVVFTGFVDRIEYNDRDKTYTVIGRDVLKKALDTFLIQPVKFGVDVETQTYYYSTYTANNGGEFTIHAYPSLAALHANHPETVENYSEEGVYAHAVVQWLLAMTGLREGFDIAVSHSNFYIGDITPVTFHLTSVYDAIMQIVDLLGWDFYADPQGVCRFHPKREYARGSLVSISSSVILERTDTVSNEELRNYVEVLGASGIREVRRAASPYLGTTPYRGVLISNEFIDTPQIASFIARRVLNELNRLKRVYNVTLLPIYIPSVAYRVTLPGVANPLVIESYTGSIDTANGYTLRLTAYEYIDDVLFDEPQPEITADFTATYLFTIGDPLAIVQLDGTASFSAAAPIERWVWTIGATTLSGSVVTVFLDEQALRTTGVPITLTVYDATLASGTVTKTILYSDIVQTNPVFRVLYGALTTHAVCSPDGGQTWVRQNFPATAVAASHFDILGGTAVEQAYALFVNGTNNTVYRTNDMLASYTTTTLPVAGAATLVAIAPSAPHIAYVAVGSSLCKSTDFGQTWSTVGVFPARIVSFEIDRFEPNRVYVGCDASSEAPYGGLYVLDATTLWSVNLWEEVRGSITETFREYKGGVAGRYNDQTIVMQWLRTDRYVLVYEYPSSALHLPGTIYSISPDLTDWSRLHVVLDVGGTRVHADVVASYTPGSLTLTYVPLQTNDTSFVLRDGGVDMLLWYATPSGIAKSIDRHRTIHHLYTSPDSTGVQVAYGPLTSPQARRVRGLAITATPVHDVIGFDSTDESLIGLTRRLYLAVPASGTFGSTPATATDGWVCVQRPNNVRDVTIDDVRPGIVVGRLALNENPPSLPSSSYTHAYPPGRMVPYLFDMATIFPSIAPSGSVYAPVASGSLGLCIPYVQGVAQYDDSYNVRLSEVVLSTTPSLVFAMIVTPPPKTTSGQFYRRYFLTEHALLSGVWNGTMLPETWRGALDEVLPGFPSLGSAGLYSRIRFGSITMTNLAPTKSLLVCIPTDVPTATNRVFTVYAHLASSPELIGHRGRLQNDQGEIALFPVTKATPVSYSVVRTDITWPYTVDNLKTKPLMLLTNKLQGAVPLSLPADGDIRFVVSSRLPQSSVLYYATDQTVYKVDRYGQGTATSILTVPEGPITSLRCSTDGVTDMLAIVFPVTGTALPKKCIAVSTDGGQTWGYHSVTLETVNGVVFDAWVVP